jgi:hypothetical protein
MIRTHLETTNYWAPLHEEEDDDDRIVEQINPIINEQLIPKTKTNKLTRRIERRKQMKLVIDSGATSNFVPESMDLPKKGRSMKEVYLPDDTKLKATYKTELPFEQLSSQAREADILPGLTTPLISVNKLAEEGYTTIFHPGEQGVTIHQSGTVKITNMEPPILQGCKENGANLWTISVDQKATKEKALHAYDLPSVNQTVRYLHAAAGFPVKETWLKEVVIYPGNQYFEMILKGLYCSFCQISSVIVRRYLLDCAILFDFSFVSRWFFFVILVSLYHSWQ